MIKKLLLVLLSLSLLPGTVFASGQSGQFYPPSNSDYFNKKFSWQIFFSNNVKKVEFTQYDVKMKKQSVLYHNSVKGNSYLWVDFYCQGMVSVEFFDKKGKVVDSFIRGTAERYLNDSSCSYSSAVTFSDYDEKKDRYASDMFKKKEKENKQKPYREIGSNRFLHATFPACTNIYIIFN